MGQLIIHFTQQSSLYFAYNLSLTAWGRCQKCPCIPKQLGDLGRILFYITFTPCSPLGILCKSLIPNSCQYFGLSDFHRNLREIYSTSLLCKFKTYPLRFQKQSVARDTIKKSGTILHCFQILTDYFFSSSNTTHICSYYIRTIFGCAKNGAESLWLFFACCNVIVGK